MHALVVDDSKAMRMIVSRFLKEAGYEVAEAGDGVQALVRLSELAATSPPVVALVDWNMPEMNGYEFVLAVRASANWTGLRIVMVTSESEMDRVAAALEAGADEYLMKPFTREEILGKLSLLGLPNPSLTVF